MILFVFYLIIMSFFLQNQTIEQWQIYFLILIYIIHIFVMKYNHSYEVTLKRAVANYLEIRELNRLASQEISHFHYNLDSRVISIEILNQINYSQDGDILIFDVDNKKDMKDTIPSGG